MGALNSAISNDDNVAALTDPKSTADRHNNQRKLRQYRRKIPKDRLLTDNELQQLTVDVLDLVHHWFPRLHEQTYFLPPVYMNKVQREERRPDGRTVAMEIQASAESDWRDSEVMQRTLHCLKAFADRRQEAMVVLLQMEHEGYLNKPCYAPAARLLPRPADLPAKLKRGDFDILVLHAQHGMMVAEIKSVGWRPGEIQDTDTVRRTVEKAVRQLTKAQRVLTHLVHDLHPAPSLTSTLILPNVTSSRLRQVLQMDVDLGMDLCKCFHVSSVHSAVQLCLCADQMTTVENPADVTNDVLEEMNQWWNQVMTPSQVCTPEVYELLVARFCGPASTVRVHCVTSPRLELRTLGHAVQEVGQRMAQFALYPEQLALLQSGERCVYLTGPPGTGKTLLLVLMAVQWCRRGHVVHVVSSESFSEAANQLLYYQVVKTLKETGDPEAVSRVVLHSNGNSVRRTEEILSELCAASGCDVTSDNDVTSRRDRGEQLSHQPDTTNNNCCVSGTAGGEGVQGGGELYVVADEVEAAFCRLWERLRARVHALHVWAASYSHGHRPDAMFERRLTVCVRSTPVVRRRMQTAISFSNGQVYGFEDRGQEYMSPTEGPTELRLSHADHAPGPALDCVQCGQDIADCLHNTLGVGKREKFATSVKLPACLEYRDVIIIPDWYQNQELVDRDPSPEVPDPPVSGLVRGLRCGGVPVYVVRRHDEDRVRDLARSALDAVAVVEWGVCNGLERKVVVSVGQGRQMSGGVSGVLHGASRCVSQLVYVMCPEV